MIYLGSDHAGFKLKEKIKGFLHLKGIEFEDLTPIQINEDDYPDAAKKVANKVKSSNTKGILICGSGTGMAIAANRIKGIRAVLAYDSYSAKMARHDNDANIICLRGRKTLAAKAKRYIDIFLKTKFSGLARHKRRIKKLD